MKLGPKMGPVVGGNKKPAENQRVSFSVSGERGFLLSTCVNSRDSALLYNALSPFFFTRLILCGSIF